MLKRIKKFYIEVSWFKLKCKVAYLHKKSLKKAQKNKTNIHI